MDRVERKRYEKAVPDLNRHYNPEGIWFDFPGEEDFGLDIPTHRSGITNGVKWQEDFKTELKTISTQYGKIFKEGSFYRRTACRNRSWRYGLTGGTKVSQNEISADTTPPPDWFHTTLPLQVLNAADKHGDRDNCKLRRLLSDKANLLVFMYSNGYLVYDMDDLVEAIVGYAWQRLPHTKELDDSDVLWELKAVIDLESPTDYIKGKIPEEYL